MAILLSLSGVSRADAVAVIGHAETPDLSGEKIKSLYLGFSDKLPDGTPAKVYLHREAAVRARFLKEVLGIDERKFKSHWLKKTLAGEGVAPAEKTTEEMISLAREKKGTIGICPVSKSMDKDIKIILRLQ